MKYYAVYFCKNQWLSVFHVLKFALCTSPTIKPNCNLVSNAWASYMASILIVSRWVCKSTRTLRLHPTTSPHDPNTKQGAPRMQLQRHEIHWNPYFPYILLIFVVSLCFWRFFFVDFGYFYSSPGPSGPPSFAANSQIEDDRVTRIDFLDHRKYMEIWRISDGYRRIQSILKNRFLQFLTTPKWFCRHCEAGTWWPTETKIAWERQRRRQRRQR